MKTRRRILFISNFYPPYSLGGYEIGAESIIYAFQKAGHKVRVLTSLPVKDGKYIKTVCRTRDVKTVFSPTYYYWRTWEKLLGDEEQWMRDKYYACGLHRVENIAALAVQIKEFQPDLVYFFNPLGLGPVGLLQYCQDNKISHLIHSMDHLTRYITTDAQWIGQGELAARVLRATPWIFCSPTVAEPYPFTQVISNTPRQEFWRGRLPVVKSFEKIRAVYWGRISRYKGFDQMVAIARALQDESWFLGLDVIGPPEEHIVMPADVPKLRLLPPIDVAKNMRAIRKRYNVGVFPLTEQEPFAYSPLESILCGLATVVSADTGGAHLFTRRRQTLAPRSYTMYQAFADALGHLHAGKVGHEVCQMRCQVERHLHPAKVMQELTQFAEKVIAEQYR